LFERLKKNSMRQSDDETVKELIKIFGLLAAKELEK
jgi:hypothetical protein